MNLLDSSFEITIESWNKNNSEKKSGVLESKAVTSRARIRTIEFLASGSYPHIKTEAECLKEKRRGKRET